MNRSGFDSLSFLTKCFENANGFFVQITEERKDLKPTIGYIGRYARHPPLSEIGIKDYIGDMIAFEYQDTDIVATRYCIHYESLTSSEG